MSRYLGFLNPLNSTSIFYLSGLIFLALNWTYRTSWSGVSSWVALFSLISIQFTLQLFLMAQQKTTTRFWFLISVGLLSRLLIIGTDPWLEDDHYRYFWDGHVQNQGLSPYIYPPISPELDFIDTSYRHLINYPEVPTVYPTLAQSTFRFLNWVSPANTTAFQLFFLIIDLIILSLLWCKRKLGRGYLLYWISPFILKEFFNSIHIDFLMLQFFFLSVIWIRSWKGSVFISFASLVKIFPAIFLISDLTHKNRKWALRVLAPICCFAIAVWLDSSLLAISQGLTQFSKYWTFNDSFFKLLTFAIPEQKLARMATGFGFLAVTSWLCWKHPYRIQRRIHILSALFFFSPVLNPWYFCWVLPFLCFRPDLRLYSLGLPLYLGYSFFVDPILYQHLEWIQAFWMLLIFLWVLKKHTSSNFFFLRSTSFKSRSG